MWILLLLFSSFLSAQDSASEKYCFSSAQESAIALHKFNAIKVPSDTATIDQSCLVVQMSPHRRELIQRYILSSFPDAKISFSSADLKREPCLIKVEKERILSSTSADASLNGQVSIAATQTGAQANEVFQVQTLKDFELSVDQDQIKGTCKFINQNRYEIILEVKRKPRPLVPENLPPGSIVIINQAPADQNTSSLQTQLELNRGERTEIGAVIRELKKKDHSAELGRDAGAEITNQNISEKVFLSFQ